MFWNMDDYPIPVGIDNLASFRSNIEEALDQMGFRGPKQFSVNCEQLNCETKEALGEARFFYLPIWLYVNSSEHSLFLVVVSTLSFLC